MPIHDWTRVKAGIFHDFHGEWIFTIKHALNGGVLPPGYYAMAEQITKPVEPDVLTLDRRSNGKPIGSGSGGSVALATTPPQVWHRAKSTNDAAIYAAKAKTLVIRHVSDHHVVAVVEIVSPGNKDRDEALGDFVSKALGFLKRSIHLLILDLFPPTSRDPQGIHKAIWDEVTPNDFALPADRRLTLAAYDADFYPEAFVEPTAPGLSLKDMPLFLTPELYVPVPLDQTYQSAWEAVPEYWRDVVSGRSVG